MKFGKKSKDETPKNEMAEPTEMDAGHEEAGVDPSSICDDFLRNGMTGDKYRMHGQIGQGGMGTVFKVFDEGLKRTTVLKVLSPEMMDNPQYLKRFVDEARITGQLEHPNIIPVHDIGVVDRSRIYFSMKYIEGEELGGILRRLRRGDEDAAKRYSLYSLLTIFRKVCDAVAFAHSRGVIHRDIKPDNIMVAKYGEVMLVDWGLARPENAHDRDTWPEGDMITAMNDTSSLKTRDGMIKGTPAYMAPEQASGQVGLVDRRTDIFLLGSTLYAIATLHPPYTGDNIYDILDNAEAGVFQAPGQRAPERQLPEELCRIIIRAMALDPDERYQSVERLSEDLDALLEGRTVSIHKRFLAGEVLMKEGDHGDEAYVIVSGEVEVLKTIRGQDVAVVTLREGDTVGEMAMISNAPRSATVRATRNTDVVVITEDLITQGLAKLPPWMGKTVEAVVDRLRAATSQIHPLAAGDCTYHVVNQLRLLYPYWGCPVHVPEGGQRIALPLEATVLEIAITLCLDKDRVAELLSRLLDARLVLPLEGGTIHIPHYQLFCDFVAFARQKCHVESPLWRSSMSTLYASANQLALSQVLDESGAESDEVAEVLAPDVQELLGCETPDELADCFESIFSNLQQQVGSQSGG